MTEQPLLIQKHVAYLEVPYEMLMDYGVIEDTRPPRPPPSLRTRLRWKRQELRERLGQRAYEFVSGQDFPEADEW